MSENWVLLTTAAVNVVSIFIPPTADNLLVTNETEC